jgi:hypothetical protein
MPTLNNPVIHRYYPSLSSIVSLDNFPEALGFLKEGIQNIFDKIHYKDLQYKKSPNGDAAFYSLSIVSKKLAFELFGTGINFLLNPDDDDNNISAFPITLEYRWKILAYLRSFNSANFSFSPQEFFELGLMVLNISEEQALAQFVNTFTEPASSSITPLQQFVQDLKQNNIDDPTIQTLPLTVDENTQLTDIAKAVNQHTQKYATTYAFGAYLLKNGIAETKDKVNSYFETFHFSGIEEYLKDLLLPEARATLTVSAAVEFPRRILYPYKLNGTVWEPEDAGSGILTRFYFGKVELYADTKAGLGYTMDLIGNLTPTFSEIGKTGLLIQLERLKVDLSDKTNIPEADADGRPAGFRGVYADALSVMLPSRWFKTNSNTGGSTLRIGGYNLLIGTGGISGTFALEAVPTINPSNDEVTDFFSSRFSFQYPITGLKNNKVTHREEKHIITNHTELIQYLNVLENKNLYRFSFPLTILPAGQLPVILYDQRAFRNYITDVILQQNGTMWFNIGSETRGFRIGFKAFDISFHQNAITSSNIKGVLEVPRFKQGANPLTIDVAGHLYEDGDFSLTASIEGGLSAHLSDLVYFNFKTFELGRNNDNFYLGTCCDIWFGDGIMQRLLGDQIISLPELRIYSNGHIEFVGGVSFIPTNITLNLGPIEISVTNINLGSYQQVHEGVQRNYNFVGFDGAISLDPLGIDARGEGVKYYYTTDNDDHGGHGHSFLRIQTIEIDLVIPGSANPDTAVAIIHGMVSIPEPGHSPEYIGEVSLKMPKAKISGGASMRLQPKSPAFLVDAYIDLPKPIPLGPLGIYGFRGLVGFRYVAEKEAVGLVSGVDSWYDYYKYPPKGVHISKFSGPERTKEYAFPFSIGAGAVLGTDFDSGTTLSVRAMLLLSIPTLFLIEGKAAILTARLGLSDDREPPFFAFIAWGDHSIEMGIGADFKLPGDSGWILDMKAKVEAGFFFNNSSPWYVNFGSKQEPLNARLLTIVTARTYLMISAQGIEAGARVEFDLRKHFGPAKVHLYAYLEVGGHISFERPQIGGYIALGGMIDIDIWIIGITIGLDAILSVEAAKPFLLYAELSIKVCVKLVIKKICKKFTIQLKWEKNNEVDRTPIKALPDGSAYGQQDRTRELVKGVHMLTNDVFELNYADTLAGLAIDKVIPSDTYIDIRVAKGLIPNSVDSKIGGHTTGAENFTDLISPEAISRSGRHLRQVKHSYSIESIEIKAWNGTAWVDYHPYQAIIEGEDVTSLKIGYWQRSGNQYNTLRLLATNPFSFIESGEPGWFTPEQYGINPSTLFCVGVNQEPHCSNVLNKPINTIYYPPTQYVAHFINGAYYTLATNSSYDPTIQGILGLNGNFMKVTDAGNPFGFSKSLSFNNYNTLIILLPDASATVELKLTTNAAGASIKLYKKILNDLIPEPQFQLIDTIYKTQFELQSLLAYQNTADPISKIEIVPDEPNAAQISDIMEQIAQLFDETYNNNTGAQPLTDPDDIATYNTLLAQLNLLQNTGCATASQSFFSGFYTTDNPDVNFFKAISTAKIGNYYFIAAAYSTDLLEPGVIESLILKIGSDGQIIKEIKVEGLITDFKAVDDCIIATLAKQYGFSSVIETPYLVKLDADLSQIAAKELDPVYKEQYNQLALLPGTDYGLWVSSNFRSPDTGDSSFANATRVIVFNTTNLEEKTSVLIKNTIAKKVLVLDSENFILMANSDPINKKSSLVFVKIDSDWNFNAANAVESIEDFRDIALLESGEIIVTGKIGTTPNKQFIGKVNEADIKLYNSVEFINGTLKLAVDDKSLLRSEVWLYDNEDVIFLKPSSNMGLSGAKKISQPSSIPGSGHSIKSVVNNYEESEVYMLSDTSGAMGVVFTVMPENFDTCIVDDLYFDPQFQEDSSPLTPRISEVELTNPNFSDSSSLISPSTFMALGNIVCPVISLPGTTIQCRTSLQQICWLTMNRFEFNSTIPGQAAIAEDQATMILGMQKTAQPIWRPDTQFHIHFTLKDTVDNGQSSPGIFNYYYGFKTVGPLGHYHKDPQANYIPAGANPDQYPLSSLRQYIDYNRSYPNADGNLLQSKPLFYGANQCKITVFFSKAFAYHMMQNWYGYNGLTPLNGEMHIAIKDPVTDVIVPYPLPANWENENVPLPDGSPVWAGDSDPNIPLNIQMLNNMINYVNSTTNAIQCTLNIGAPIQPSAYAYSVTLTNLLPSKLYTAIVMNSFKVGSAGELKNEQVHQFGFQTSRYANFEEQVNSYKMIDENQNIKQAVFSKVLSLTTEQITAAYNIASGISDPLSLSLESRYIDLFDRVMDGIMQIGSLEPAERTEFTFLKQESTGNIFGLLIRNPEPFNNPKIPLSVIQLSVRVYIPRRPFSIIHSKDRSHILMIHPTSFSISSLLLLFSYKVWNGSDYYSAADVYTSISVI